MSYTEYDARTDWNETTTGSARYCVKCGYPVISDDMDDSEVADLYIIGEQLCEACEEAKLEQDNA